MSVARLVAIFPDGLGMVGPGMAISVPADTTAVLDAADALRTCQRGDRIHLWKDVDLVAPLDRLGEPHADLLMGDGGWMRVLPEFFTGGENTADHVLSASTTAVWVKPLPDGLWAYLGCEFYAAVDLDSGGDLDTGPAGGPWCIEQQAEYLVCRDPGDPGGTEVAAEYQRINMGPVAAGADLEAVRDEVAAAELVAPSDAEWKEYAPTGYSAV